MLLETFAGEKYGRRESLCGDRRKAYIRCCVRGSLGSRRRFRQGKVGSGYIKAHIEAYIEKGRGRIWCSAGGSGWRSARC
jgi:hypothetical protein